MNRIDDRDRKHVHPAVPPDHVDDQMIAINDACDLADVEKWPATVPSVISQDVAEHGNVVPEGVEDHADPVSDFRSPDLWSTLRHL